MQFKTYIKSKLPLYLALSSLFVLASCGSYQYVGSDNDGIYGTSETAKETTYTEEVPVSTENNAYYKGYFAEKSDKYGRIAGEENVIFTDIDSYEGTYNDQTGEVEYQEGYAGWGQDSDNLTINVYSNNAWNGWYSPWAWNYGWGWNNWYSPWGYYGYGWNNWGWYGYGYGYPYAWGPAYYGAYYGGYGYPYYYRNNIAYNSGRRGSGYINNSNRSSYSNRSSLQTTRRNSSTIRRSSDARYNPANSIRSNNNVRSNATRSNNRINTPTRSTSPNTRVNTPTRSSSSPSVRSSSPVRSSSGGSGRSSGGGSSRRGG